MTSRFYESYSRFKSYSTPVLKAKHAARFEHDFWQPVACETTHSVLEIGCGTGLFLLYLRKKGVKNFLGIDLDPALSSVMPSEVQENFKVVDVWEFLTDTPPGAYDRIVLFDVIEHFEPEQGLALLERLRKALKPGGRILLKTPNGGSPWGMQHLYGDLTHKTAYTPNSLRHLAVTAGYRCLACRPHFENSPRRQWTDKAFHAFLSRLLMTPPEIWTANFFAVLEKELP
jgi:2-polyprenyl-3-methyl-5-hydroxy-6-metoxy-1,4-benzoquinol methylase